MTETGLELEPEYKARITWRGFLLGIAAMVVGIAAAIVVFWFFIFPQL